MFFYLIPAVLIVISLVIIIFIIVKKLPNLAAINIESIAEEEQAKVKNRLITQRLARSFFEFKKILVEIFQPLIEGIISVGNNFYQKIIELEKKNLGRTKPLKKIDLKQQIKEKLETGEKFLADQDLTKAEEVGISIVKLDSKNLDAYEFLAKVYLAQKEYKKARDTGRYLLKLLTKIKDNGVKHRLASCYVDLGLVYQLENKHNYALSNFQKAVRLEPNNPRFLDLLLKICIILKNKKLAQQIFISLKKADPGNQKLAGLKDEINTINN